MLSHLKVHSILFLFVCFKYRKYHHHNKLLKHITSIPGKPYFDGQPEVDQKGWREEFWVMTRARRKQTTRTRDRLCDRTRGAKGAGTHEISFYTSADERNLSKNIDHSSVTDIIIFLCHVCTSPPKKMYIGEGKNKSRLCQLKGTLFRSVFGLLESFQRCDQTTEQWRGRDNKRVQTNEINNKIGKKKWNVLG